MFKNILIGTGIAVTSYTVGKTVAYVRCFKCVMNEADKIFPGIKKDVIKKVSSKIVDIIFETDTQSKESC